MVPDSTKTFLERKVPNSKELTKTFLGRKVLDSKELTKTFLGRKVLDSKELTERPIKRFGRVQKFKELYKKARKERHSRSFCFCVKFVFFIKKRNYTLQRTKCMI